MMKPSLLILTKPSHRSDKFKFLICKLLGSQYNLDQLIHGHPGVTRSLLDGLKKLKVSFEHNPIFVKHTFDLCLVPCSPEVVLQAINLKRRGLIKKLLVGPNISVRSNEHNSLLARSEVDICLVPSDWVKRAYIEDEPSLKKRISVWYAGVDEKFWSPTKLNKPKDSKKILIYCKTDNLALCNKIKILVARCGFIPIKIIYGEYEKKAYRRLLSDCRFSIFLSPSESQGLALAESWSMNVPSLVLRAKRNIMISGKLYTDVSSAPYLNKNVGEFWNDINNLTILLKSDRKYYPRRWILNNMTDEISINKLRKICEDKLGEKF